MVYVDMILCHHLLKQVIVRNGAICKWTWMSICAHTHYSYIICGGFSGKPHIINNATGCAIVNGKRKIKFKSKRFFVLYLYNNIYIYNISQKWSLRPGREWKRVCVCVGHRITQSIIVRCLNDRSDWPWKCKYLAKAIALCHSSKNERTRTIRVRLATHHI